MYFNPIHTLGFLTKYIFRSKRAHHLHGDFNLSFFQILPNCSRMTLAALVYSIEAARNRVLDSMYFIPIHVLGFLTKFIFCFKPSIRPRCPASACPSSFSVSFSKTPRFYLTCRSLNIIPPLCIHKTVVGCLRKITTHSI